MGRGRGAVGPQAGDVRRVWAPVGKRPIARFKRGYKWTYLYGFVRLESGDVYRLILLTVNVKVFSMALSAFAKEMGVGEEKCILLVVDRAGWPVHMSVLCIINPSCPLQALNGEG